MSAEIITQPKEEIAAFVSELQGERLPWGSYSTIGLVKNGRLAAGVVLNHYYPGLSICMHIAAEGKCWPTPEFIFAIFDYPFNQLRLRRVTGLVAKKNAAARRYAEHLGAKLEGSMRHALPHDDLLIYGMLARDCRWIAPEFRERLAARAVRRVRLAEAA